MTDVLDLSPSALVIRGADGVIRTSTDRQEFLCTNFLSGTLTITSAEQNAASAPVTVKSVTNLGAIDASAEFVLGHMKVSQTVISYIGGRHAFENNNVYPIGGTALLFNGLYQMKPDEGAGDYKTSQASGATYKISAAIAVTFFAESGQLKVEKQIYFPYLTNGSSDQEYTLGDMTIYWYAFACRFSVL